MNRTEGETNALFREVPIVFPSVALTHHQGWSSRKVWGQKDSSDILILNRHNGDNNAENSDDFSPKLTLLVKIGEIDSLQRFQFMVILDTHLGLRDGLVILYVSFLMKLFLVSGHSVLSVGTLGNNRQKQGSFINVVQCHCINQTLTDAFSAYAKVWIYKNWS